MDEGKEKPPPVKTLPVSSDDKTCVQVPIKVGADEYACDEAVVVPRDRKHSDNMEEEKETLPHANPRTVSPESCEDMASVQVYLKPEPSECACDISDATDRSLDGYDASKNFSQSGWRRSNGNCSKGQEESGDYDADSCVEQEEAAFGKGVVIMTGEDFVVELDPDYESEDESELTLEVKLEGEHEHESGEMEVCIDSTAGEIGISSGGQRQFYCPAPAPLPRTGGVAADARVGWGGSGVAVERPSGDSALGRNWRCPPSTHSHSAASGSSAPAAVGGPLPQTASLHLKSDVALKQNPSDSGPPDSSGSKAGNPTPGHSGGAPAQSGGEEIRALVVYDNGRKYLCCPECPKMCRGKHVLRDHILAVHRTEKRFSCPECGKRFRVRGNMMLHLRNVHTNVTKKKHPCIECGKPFSRKCNLRSHLLAVHRKEWRFSCSECGEKFAGMNQMRTHAVTVHARAKKAVCPECGKEFRDKRYLPIHVAVVHGKEKSAQDSKT